MYVEADCLLRLAVVCRGFVVGKLWEDRVQRFWPGLWEHHSDGAWPGLSSIVNERVAKMMLNCSVCVSFCIILPLKFHVFTSGKCKGKCDSALQRSNMCVFQNSPRAFQALYAGTSGRVSPVDEAIARKVARGTETCAETPRNMVMFTLYHQGTMLGRSCSHSVRPVESF